VEDVAVEGYRYLPFTTRTYEEDVVLEGCRWKEAFIHPRDADGVLIFLGERTPVAGAT